MCSVSEQSRNCLVLWMSGKILFFISSDFNIEV